MLSANVGAEDALGRALAADPKFALAHAARARSLQLRGAMAEARAAAARAVELASSATRRERGHVEAIALNVEPDMPRTLAHVLEHLREFPRDGLVLSLASRHLRLDRLQRAPRPQRIPAGPARRPGRVVRRGLVVSQRPRLRLHRGGPAEARAAASSSAPSRSTRVTRTRLTPRARRVTRATPAMKAPPSSGPGSPTTTGPPSCTAISRGTWRCSSWRWAARRIAWTLYDDYIRPANSYASALITLSDSVSLLWRCRLWDKERGAVAWGELRDFARQSFPAPSVAFADAHAGDGFAAYGDRAGADARIDELRRAERAGASRRAASRADVAEAMAAFARGDDDAVDPAPRAAAEGSRAGWRQPRPARRLRGDAAGRLPALGTARGGGAALPRAPGPPAVGPRPLAARPHQKPP